MKGYHELREFKFPNGLGEAKHECLPDGWKPFASFRDAKGVISVVARKWHSREGQYA